MVDPQKLRTDFFNAQRALISSLFACEEHRNPTYVHLALDRMNRAFNALMLSILDPFDMNDCPPEQELLCAYAVNMGDDWNGSNWQVMFVNSEVVASPSTVGEFTRQMITNGWKVFSPQGGECEPDAFYTPNGDPVYALYFSRLLPPKSEDPSKVTALPELRIERMSLSSN